MVKTIVLPRQVRDKDKETLTNRSRISQAGSVPPHSVMPTLKALTGSSGYLLSGGRDGMYLWYCATTACVDDGQWVSTNVAAHHNAVVDDPFGQFPAGCVNESGWQNIGMLGCPSKSYLGLTILAQARTAADADTDTASFVVCYSHCGNVSSYGFCFSEIGRGQEVFCVRGGLTTAVTANTSSLKTDDADSSSPAPQSQHEVVVRIRTLQTDTAHNPTQRSYWMLQARSGASIAVNGRCDSPSTECEGFTATQVLSLIEKLRPTTLERFISGQQDLWKQVPVDAGQPNMTVKEFLNAAQARLAPGGEITVRASLNEWCCGKPICHPGPGGCPGADGPVPNGGFAKFLETTAQLWKVGQQLNVPFKTIGLDNWSGPWKSGVQPATVKAMLQGVQAQGWNSIAVNEVGGFFSSFGLADTAEIGVVQDAEKTPPVVVDATKLAQVKNAGIANAAVYIDFPAQYRDFDTLSVDQQADSLVALGRNQTKGGYRFVWAVVQGHCTPLGHYNGTHGSCTVLCDTTRTMTSKSGKYAGKSLFDVIVSEVRTSRAGLKTDDTNSSETREKGHGATYCPAIDWRKVPPPPPPTLRGKVAHTSRILTAGSYCHAGETGGTCGGYLDYGGPTCVLSANETLLCFFCGEKKIHSDDDNWADVVLRRSFDRGRSWQPLQVVASDNNASTPRGEWQTYGNTAAVLDRSTGKIVLLFDKNNTRLLVTSSSDHGATFESPRDITAATKPKNWGWTAVSFSGVQLRTGPHRGRMVVALCFFDHFPEIYPPYRGDWYPISRSGVLYSDTGGRTWEAGGHTQVNMTDNEAAISELADGTLVLNSRNYLGASHYGTIHPYGQSDYGEGYNYSAHPPHRGLSFSTDSGATFSDTYHPPALEGPTCEGAQLTGWDTPAELGIAGNQTLFFTNPAATFERANLTMKMSVDGGCGWSEVVRVNTGTSMYSSIVQFVDGAIGVAFDDGSDIHCPPKSAYGCGSNNETFKLIELSKAVPT